MKSDLILSKNKTCSFLLIRPRFDWFSALIATVYPKKKNNCWPNGLKRWLCNQASSSGRLVRSTAPIKIISRSDCSVIRFTVGATVTVWMTCVLVPAETLAFSSSAHILKLWNDVYEALLSDYDGTGETMCYVSACYFSVSGPRKTETSYCHRSVWLLCISSISNNHSVSPWHSGMYVGVSYEKEGPHGHANICMKTDSVGTHNLDNISTWKVESLQEGHLNSSWGPLLASYSCSHRHTWRY